MKEQMNTYRGTIKTIVLRITSHLLFPAFFILPVYAVSISHAAGLRTNIVDGVQWVYTLQNGYASLGGGTLDTATVLPDIQGDIIVPEQLGGFVVTNISSYAFANRTGITSISVPKCVATIQSSAFMGCNSLTNMILPFVGNKRRYANDDWPDAWASDLFGYVFGTSTAEGMVSVSQWYRSGNMSGNNFYMKYSIPESLESVEITDEECFHLAVFENCSMLKRFVFPRSICSIHGEAFNGCTNLREIHISDLAGWCSLNGASLGGSDSPMKYPCALFLNGELISDVIIPEEVTSFKWKPFQGCTNITSVTIPDSIQIPNAFFDGCSSITNMLIPFVGGKKSTGSYDNTFGELFGYSECDGCIPVTQKSSSESWAQSTRYVPQGVKTVSVSRDGIIGYGAFQNCTMIEEISISGTVSNIGYNAFSGCTGLKRLIFLGDAPVVNSSAFTQMNPECVVYVSRSSTGWGVDIPGTWKGFSIAYLEEDGIAIDRNLPHAIAERPYAVQLVASGGMQPYIWSMTSNMYGQISQNGILTVYTTGRDNSSSQQQNFDIVVMDVKGMISKETITVVIDPNPNQKPVISSPLPVWAGGKGCIPVGQEQTFSINAHDPENEALMFFWSLDYNNIDCPQNEWTWIPKQNDIGTHILRVYCTDGEWRSATNSWYFNVFSTNVLDVATNMPFAVIGQQYDAIVPVLGGTEPYSFMFNMYRTDNSFAESGVAQNWSDDDGCWNISLPFPFPFYGKEYDEIWISDNGTICLDGPFSQWYFMDEAFKSNALIAPFWCDLNGRFQTIFVDDTIDGQLTIRWSAQVYGLDQEAHFSATLSKTGTIRFSYGNIETSGNVGISAGDGEQFVLLKGFQNLNLTDIPDIILPTANCPAGLSALPDGTISGIPSDPGRYHIPLCVADADGVMWDGVLDLLVLPGADYTTSSPAPVPYSFFDMEYPSILSANNGDYEASANAVAANGVNKVWECYVTGISPTNEVEKFEVTIELDADGELIVKWKPDLNENGTRNERVYMVEGRKSMTRGAWGKPNADSLFFRVKVTLP